MALIQVIKYDGPSHILVWKSPKEDITTGSQLIVGPAQEAVFVRGGQICDVLPSGTYTLNTDNLPLLSALINLPFGGKSPFSAEIFFLNKLNILDIKWGTPVPVHLIDPVYKIAIPLRAFGQYGVAVEDSCLFLEKLVGSAGHYTTEDLMGYFRGLVGTRIVDELARCLMENKISYLDASAHLVEFSDQIAACLREFFAEYGIRLVNFCINSINAPEDDPSVQKLKQVLSKQQEMSALQFNYHQDKTYDILGRAADHLEGSGAGLQVGAALGATMAELAKETLHTPTAAHSGQSPRFCRHCGAALSDQAAFCSKCGQAISPPQSPRCPVCGRACQPGDRFCSQCGQALSPASQS